MDENILVDIQVPAVSMRFDASIPLYAPAADILRHLIDWISQQMGLSLSDDGHFLCNARTGEIRWAQSACIVPGSFRAIT